MIEIVSWTESFAQKLQGIFGERLLFVGYQGSYGRGEATEQSDVDIVTVLDRVGAKDLALYRAAVQEQPSGELACGFLCGKEELLRWPKADSLSLLLDTLDVYGELRPLLPPFTARDAWEALRMGAAGLYHAACHARLYDSDPKASLPGLGKAAFFCLRTWLLCCNNLYLPTKASMMPLLSPRERVFIQLGTEPQEVGALTDEEVDLVYGSLIDWCREQLCGREPLCPDRSI